MKLWTLQPVSALDEIRRTGSYRCQKDLSYNLKKSGSLDPQYQWLIARMEQKIGKRPEGVAYPIWAWHTWEGVRQSPDPDSAAFLKRTEDKVLFTLDLPDSRVVLTDFEAWQTVLQYGYLTNETDDAVLDRLEETLSDLSAEALDQAIQDSWENVFDITARNLPDLRRGFFVQATFWEILPEYVSDTQIFPKL